MAEETFESILRDLGYPDMHTDRYGQGMLNGTDVQQPLRAIPPKYDLRGKNTNWRNRQNEVVDEKTAALPFDDLLSDPALQPKDWNMHHLRKNNPALNDYQFKTIAGGVGRGDSEIHALHHGNPGAVASLRWEEPLNSWDTDAPIKLVKTDPEHRGKGLATAMWDYAHLSDKLPIKPIHSHNRSNAGDGWANFVTKGPRLRSSGYDREEY